MSYLQVKDRLKMHKEREDERLAGAANKASAEEEFDARVRESEVSACAHLHHAALTSHCTEPSPNFFEFVGQGHADGYVCIYLQRMHCHKNTLHEWRHCPR